MIRFSSQRIALILALALCVATSGWSFAEPDLDGARTLYQQTQYREALEKIEPIQPKSASTPRMAGGMGEPAKL